MIPKKQYFPVRRPEVIYRMGAFVAKKSLPLLITALVLAIQPGAAMAYIGPGVGLGAIGAILGVIGAVFLAIFAVVWYPIKRGILRRTVGHIKAVDGVTVSVRQGETLGVVGESGSGKTTLGLALLRLISSKGPIVFLGNPIQGLKFKAMRPLRRDMQVVFQDPYGSLSPRMSITDIVSEGLGIHQPALSASERDARAAQALFDVGLDPATRHRYPHEFSGGQRQRVAVARAMVLEPTFVVLDEPTSALDMLFQAQMVDLLRDLQRKNGLTYIFISHDLRVVASLASHLIVMRHGKIVEEGPAAELFKAPKTDYTKALFAAAFRMQTAPVGAVAE